jgi:glycosyltransferase involved in cell wall biosynthesis
MREKKKVLHVLSSHTFSGAENVVCQIISLVHNEIDSNYCSPIGPIKNALIKKNISYTPIKKLSVIELRKVIKKLNPDIVHAHDVKASVIAALSTPKRIRIISHMHVNDTKMRHYSIKSIIYRLVSKRYLRIIWVSRSAYDDYVFKLTVEKRSIIAVNTIDRNSVVQRSNNKTIDSFFDIISVGRLTYQKNPQRLIEILKQIINLRPSTKACIIGNGDLYNEVNTMIQNDQLENNISMMGFIDNPLPYVRNSKIFVMTSRYEGTPMVALEAMSLGIPIISTPTDGMINLIDNGKTGFLSEKNDQFIENILQLLDDEKLRDEMSEATKSKLLKLNDEEEYKNKIIETYLM